MTSFCPASIHRNTSLSRLKQTLLLTLVSMVLSVTIIMRVTKAVQKCSYGETVRVVQELCTSYRRGQLHGNMCNRLCEEDVFTYEFCGQDDSSDKFVLSMGCHGCNLGKDVSNVIMKGSFHAEQLQNITRNLFVTSKPLHLIILQTEKLINKHLISHLGESLPGTKDVLSKLLGADFNAWASEKPRDTILTMLRTLVSLSMQPEYAKMAALGPTPYLPKLYGFCGKAFFVENTPSLNQQGYIIPYKSVSEIVSMRLSLASWSERAKAALNLLSVLQILESSGTPPVHICDLEIRNTGITSGGNVVFLDIDKARYDMVFAGRKCKTDFSCGIETCMGRCDTDNGVCLPDRINNNLQAVCKKLFVGHYKGVFGLLRFPPASIKDELTRVLDQCVHPAKYPYSSKSRPHAASPEILEKLRLLLIQSIKD